MQFQNHRPLKVFAIYSHDDHLGHVTLTIYIIFPSPFLTMLHIKFGFDWPSGFREEYYGHIHLQYIAPGQGQTTPWEHFFFFFININILSIYPFQDLPLKSHLNNFPHSNAWETYVTLP